MKKSVDRVLVWGGWLLFAVIAFNVIHLHGRRWEFGRYMMPVTLLLDDGMHYADGTLAPGFVISLAHSGFEPELYLAFTISMLSMLGYAAYLCWDTEKKRKIHLQAILALERYYREERERRAAMRHQSTQR